MRRRARPLVAAALVLAACSRGGPQDRTIYRSPDGSFSAALPGEWRLDESAGESRRAVFYGPPIGLQPFSQSIAVYRHKPGGRWRSPQSYLAAQGARSASPRPPRPGARERTIELLIPSMHGPPRRERRRCVVVPTGAGFFAIEHSYPADAAPAPAFDAFLSSFRPSE